MPTITVPMTCLVCKTRHNLDVTDDQLTRIKKWASGEAGLIQNVLPDLTTDERELLINGLCNIAWGKMSEQ